MIEDDPNLPQAEVCALLARLEAPPDAVHVSGDLDDGSACGG